VLQTIGEAGVLSLPQDESDIFHAFHKWLYTRKLSDNLEDSELQFIDLFKIYVYGDLRVAPGLKNAAMDAIIKRHFDIWASPDGLSVKYAYQNTVTTVAIRKWIVDFIVNTLDNSEERAKVWQTIVDECDLPAEFFGELVVSLIRHRSSPPRWANSKGQWSKVDMCEYHDHGNIYESEET
jgi:hypothetical protein